MSSTYAAQTPSKFRNIAAWVIQIMLAIAYFAAGGAKLAGAPMMVHTFDMIGFGQWFRYVTGVVEIAGAIALLVPGFAALGAIWLGVTMLCAFTAHMLVLDSPPGPAVVLFVLNMVVLWLRKDQLAVLKARFL